MFLIGYMSMLQEIPYTEHPVNACSLIYSDMLKLLCDCNVTHFFTTDIKMILLFPIYVNNEKILTNF